MAQRIFIRHDSIVRSDWLNAGMGRRTAEKLADNATRILREIGAFDDRAHSGRRDRRVDFLAVTSPNGWGDTHAGSATVKVRGCVGFRSYALGILRAELAAGGGADLLGKREGGVSA